MSNSGTKKNDKQLPNLIDLSVLEALPVPNKKQLRKHFNTASNAIIYTLSKIASSQAFLTEGKLNKLIQLKRHLKKGVLPKDIRKIRIGFEIELHEFDYPTKFYLTHGQILPEYILKDIFHCNLADAHILQYGGFFHFKDKTLQLLSALILIYGAVIKFFLGPNIRFKLTIEEAIKLIETRLTNDYENSKNYLYILHGLIVATENYQLHTQYEELISEVEKLEINELIDQPISTLEYLIPDIEQLCTDNSHKTLRSYIEELPTISEELYKTSYEALDITINKAIDFGLLDKYKAKARKISKTAPICTKHSLLNNTKLLRRLDSADFSQQGTKKIKNFYETLDNRVMELIESYQFKDEIKNTTQAANELWQANYEKFDKIIRNLEQEHNRTTNLKMENFVPYLVKLIKKNNKIKI
ncbi:hypothetical protein [Acinetobacter sp. TUM15071]|uniref:hypothetical protein n=1 Tax=Acinetobacter sp. TUM15071 TaxID=2609135 RepID=UPI00124D1AAE|nr:hypothetical protein [Acinetobacter sp. TUM15071]